MGRVKRGDIVVAAPPGDYGKPRPVLVIQDDVFEALPSVTVLPLTSDLRDTPLLRLPLPPGRETGLRVPSQVMVDKIVTLPRSKVGQRIGQVDSAIMREVNTALARFLGLE
jgi:mRNA interferase MazF